MLQQELLRTAGMLTGSSLKTPMSEKEKQSLWKTIHSSPCTMMLGAQPVSASVCTRLRANQACDGKLRRKHETNS